MIRSVAARCCSPCCAGRPGRQAGRARCAEGHLRRARAADLPRALLHVPQPGQAKSDLALDTYAKAMAGGASGEVVTPGDLDSSRLWALVATWKSPRCRRSRTSWPTAKLDADQEVDRGRVRWRTPARRSTIKKNTVTGGRRRAARQAGRADRHARRPAQAAGALHAAWPGQITALPPAPGRRWSRWPGRSRSRSTTPTRLSCWACCRFPKACPRAQVQPQRQLLLAGGGRGGHSGCAVLFDVKTGKRIAKVGDELDAVLAADINDAPDA